MAEKVWLTGTTEAGNVRLLRLIAENNREQSNHHSMHINGRETVDWGIGSSEVTRVQKAWSGPSAPGARLTLRKAQQEMCFTTGDRWPKGAPSAAGEQPRRSDPKTSSLGPFREGLWKSSGNRAPALRPAGVATVRCLVHIRGPMPNPAVVIGALCAHNEGEFRHDCPIIRPKLRLDAPGNLGWPC